VTLFDDTFTWQYIYVMWLTWRYMYVMWLYVTVHLCDVILHDSTVAWCDFTWRYIDEIWLDNTLHLPDCTSVLRLSAVHSCGNSVLWTSVCWTLEQSLFITLGLNSCLLRPVLDFIPTAMIAWLQGCATVLWGVSRRRRISSCDVSLA